MAQEGFVFKLHSLEGHLVLAAADSSLVGAPLFREKGDMLKEPFTLKAGFYGEAGGSPEDLKEAFSKATVGNLVGKDVIGILGLTGDPSTLFFYDSKGRTVPHLQSIVLPAED